MSSSAGTPLTKQTPSLFTAVSQSATYDSDDMMSLYCTLRMLDVGTDDEGGGGGGESEKLGGAGDGMDFGRSEVGCWLEGCEGPSLSTSAFWAGAL